MNSEEDQYLLKWAGMSIYSGGADTVNSFPCIYLTSSDYSSSILVSSDCFLALQFFLSDDDVSRRPETSTGGTGSLSRKRSPTEFRRSRATTVYQRSGEGNLALESCYTFM